MASTGNAFLDYLLGPDEIKQDILFGIACCCFAGAIFLYIMRKQAEKIFLNKERQKVEIIDVKELSHDTKRFRLSLGKEDAVLGLPTGKHIVVYAPNPEKCVAGGTWNGKPDSDKARPEVERKYTPVTGNETKGHVDIVVKIYRPGTSKMPDGSEVSWEDGGKGSLYLDGKKPGDFIEIKGPVGVNEYLGRGVFKLPGRELTVRNVGMLAGGTGLTPMLQVVQAALRETTDKVNFTLLYANKTEDDILCRDMLEELAQSSKGRFKVHYTLDFPPEGWAHEVGFITTDMIKKCLPAPSDETLVLMCGPPVMVEKACKRNLEALGYHKKAMVAF